MISLRNATHHRSVSTHSPKSQSDLYSTTGTH